MVARRLRFATTALAALVIASPAAAAWRGEDVPGSAGGLAPARSLAFDRDGRALLLFEGFHQATRRTFTGVAVRDAGGAWASRGDLQGVGWGAAQAHAYGRTRTLLVTRRGRDLVWATGRTDGTFGSFRRIASPVGSIASAANPSGDAVAAFTAARTSNLLVSERRAAGTFGTPRRFSTVAALPAVAINPRGDRLVAWFGRKGLRVKVRRAGHGWAPARTVTTDTGGPGAALHAAISVNGRFVLTWTRTDVREGAPTRLDAAVAVRARGGGWHTSRLERATLAPGAPTPDPVAVPMFDSSGRLLVAYTAARNGGTSVELADVSESARIRSIVTPSGASTTATLDDAAAGEGGSVAVTWAEHGSDTDVHTVVALRLGTGAFGPPSDLMRPGESGLAGSRVAFSPLTGEVLVVRPYVSGGTPALAAAAAGPPRS